MKHVALAAALALAFTTLCAGQALAGEDAAVQRPAPPPPALTLSKAAEEVEALKKPKSFNLEGATVATVVKWLEDEGVGVILPTSLLPKADDPEPTTLIVKVNDMPLGLVVEQFFAAANIRYAVKIAEVGGKKTALVSLVAPSAPGGGANFMMQRMRPGMGMMGGGPFGNRPGGGQRPNRRGGNNNADNAPATPAAEDAF